MTKVYKGKERPKISKTNYDPIKAILPRMWDADIKKRPGMDEVFETLGKAITDMSGDEGMLDETNRTQRSLENGRR